MSLKDDVRRKTGEDLLAAVIGVPAAFDQCMTWAVAPSTPLSFM